MLSLANAELRVDLLDPTNDAGLLGPRFCAGGYIWQISDARVGPLLSGPEGPALRPDPFNGHGLPESFRDRTRSGQRLLWDNHEGLAPGVGRVGYVDSHLTVIEPCPWHIALTPTVAEFQTQHAAAGYACAVVRRIELLERSVLSSSRLQNTGTRALELQWFAHPFFALDDAHAIRVQLGEPASVPDNSGFTVVENQLRPTQRHEGRDDGAFALLTWPTDRPLRAQLSHPQLPSGIHFSTTFAPSECPVWINGFTFSIEPYQNLVLAPGEHLAWTLRYDFGASNSSS